VIAGLKSAGIPATPGDFQDVQGFLIASVFLSFIFGIHVEI
jgi:hypothetical protein